MATEVKETYIEKTVNEYHETVTMSNDVVLITEERPEINVVFSQIDETYGQSLSTTV